MIGAFVISSASASVDVYQDLDKFNEMDVTLVIDDSDGLVSKSDPIPGGYFVLAIILGPLKFFFLGAMAATFSSRIRKEVLP